MRWGKQTVAFGVNTGIDQTRQGHTGHEMLDGGLTHMNGRLYDPVLARFVSADPHVDNPFDLQSLNRYSYVSNNPLGYTDPTGYFKLFGKKWSWWRDKVVKPVVAAWAGYGVFNLVGGYVGVMTGGSAPLLSVAAGAAAGGATMSLINTGSVNGWQYNALSMALFAGAGEIGNAGSLSRTLAHTGAGCISASASGGNCGQGALSAGFAELAGSNLPKQYDGFVTRVVLGGTAAELGGGKFGNGATTAAFGYLFNECAHTECTFLEKTKAFFRGAWSVVTGTGNSLRFVARGTGLMGAEEQARWSQEGAAVDQFFDRRASDPEFRQQTNRLAVDQAKQFYQNNMDGEMKWFMTGRLGVGAATGLGPAASIGDMTRAVENGHNTIDAAIRGGLFGRPEQ